MFGYTIHVCINRRDCKTFQNGYDSKTLKTVLFPKYLAHEAETRDKIYEKMCRQTDRQTNRLLCNHLPMPGLIIQVPSLFNLS